MNERTCEGQAPGRLRAAPCEGRGPGRLPLRVLRRVLRLLTAGLLAAGVVAAQVPAKPPAPDTPALRVAISEVPPFVMPDVDGRWQGISIDLWQAVAQSLGRPFELVPMPFQDVLPSLEAGRVDVVVGALTMTAEREARVDFTHPFYETGLAIGLPPAGQGGGWAVLSRLFSWRFASVVLGLAALLFAVGALLWLLERRRNAAQFGGPAAEGLGHGFWWAAVTMTTVGYGDKAPVTLGGRLLAIVWMFAALIMVSGFTAAVTSALTVGRLQGGIGGPQDLRGARVATVTGTVSARYLAREQIRHTAFPDLHQAMVAVQQGQLDAVVYDQPILQFRNRELEGEALRLLPGVFERQSYAFAVGSGSPLREPIARAVLRITQGEDWPAILRRYLGHTP